MDERRLELKAGILVAVAVAALVTLLLLLGELPVGSQQRLRVDFTNSGNVTRGAPVKLGGLPVGRVVALELEPARREADGTPLPVRMVLELEPTAFAALHEDVRVWVSTQGPLGESYLELSPGSVDASPLAPDATVRGRDPVRLEEVLQKVAGLLDATSTGLEQRPEAVAELVTNVASLAGTLNGVASDNREALTRLTGDLAAAAADARALSSEARAAMSPDGRGTRLLADVSATAAALRKDVPGLSRDAAQALAGLSALSSGLDAEDGKQLKDALRAYADAGKSLERIATRTERVLAEIEAGRGTIGGLHKDPAVYRDLKDLVHELKAHPWKVLWKD